MKNCKVIKNIFMDVIVQSRRYKIVSRATIRAAHSEVLLKLKRASKHGPYCTVKGNVSQSAVPGWLSQETRALKPCSFYFQPGLYFYKDNISKETPTKNLTLNPYHEISFVHFFHYHFCKKKVWQLCKISIWDFGGYISFEISPSPKSGLFKCLSVFKARKKMTQSILTKYFHRISKVWLESFHAKGNSKNVLSQPPILAETSRKLT